MKMKIANLFILLLFVIIPFCYAEQFIGVGSAPSIAASYLSWELEYGVRINDEDIVYSPVDENNEKMLLVDDLAIKYNNANLEAIWITLFFIDGDTKVFDLPNHWKRAASIVGAFQYGSTLRLSADEIREAKAELKEVISTLNDKYYRYSEMVSQYETTSVLFHETNSTLFYLTHYVSTNNWYINVRKQ